MDETQTWAEWYKRADRRVAFDKIKNVKISTVFLGIDHQFRYGPPLLFETMIFGGPHDEYQQRCSTWDEALAQHAQAVAMVRATRGPAI